MKARSMKSLLIAALLCITANAFAQDPLELLRKDLQTNKVAIITASIPLSQKQADEFWPLYREYNNELMKLGDRRVAAIKKFAARYDSLDEKTANELVKESIKIQNERTNLLEKYYKKVSKVVGGVIGARFIQVENQMLTLIDAQIVSQIPLVKAPKEVTAEPAEKK
jgi:hypothetical protein